MIGERTPDGWQVRLRTRDPGRFIGVAFLGFWLCGWAAGEAFALFMLVRGALALLNGTPMNTRGEPLHVGPALMMGAFLLVWLSLWTVGGIAAIGEFLRLLCGEDRITVASGRLAVMWSRGPFRPSRSFERSSIRRILLSSPRENLMLDTGTQHVELSRLGTRPERVATAAALRTELGLAETAEASGGTLPERWEEIITPEGERALVPNLATRRKQAVVASVLAMAAATVTLLIGADTVRDPRLAVPTLIGLVITVALGLGATWLARGRYEWRLGSGRLTLRKRYGPSVQDQFEARALRLDSSSDSDGDIWYELFALGALDAPPSRPQPAWRSSRPPNSRSIVRLMNDAATVRDLAAWLARATGLELDDRTTPSARTVELAQLRGLLEQSGPFGRFAGKLVDRLGDQDKRAG